MAQAAALAQPMAWQAANPSSALCTSSMGSNVLASLKASANRLLEDQKSSAAAIETAVSAA